MTKSIRCVKCGERVISPTWLDGDPYCLYCVIKMRQKEVIKGVRRRNATAKNTVYSRE